MFLNDTNKTSPYSTISPRDQNTPSSRDQIPSPRNKISKESFYKKMNDYELVTAIRGAIFDVFKTLGPGLLESAYEEALTEEISLRGLNVDRQVPVPIYYKGKQLPTKLQLDLLVEKRIIVELKAVEKGLQPVHYRQLQTYLRLSNLHRGILVNFNTDYIDKQDIETVFNKYCTRKNS